MKILGQYDYDSFILLNPFCTDNDLKSTAYHEMVHFSLTTMSTVGVMLFCLKKLELIAESSQEDKKIVDIYSNFLKNHSLNLQESVAVFVECIMKRAFQGQKECDEFINALKINNHTYYKYLKPVLFVFKLLKDSSCSEVILKLANGVFKAALFSMNADIYSIPVEVCRSKKLLKKSVSQQVFSKRFLPVSRFRSIISYCKAASSCEDLQQRLFSFQNVINLPFVIEDPYERLERVKCFLMDFFSDSSSFDIYKSALDKIEVCAADADDWLLRQLPFPFDIENFIQGCKLADYNQLSGLAKDYPSMLLFAGKIPETVSKAFALNGNKQIKDLEMLVYYSLRMRIGYRSYLPAYYVDKILLDSRFNSFFVVLHSCYDFDNDVVYGHNTLKDNCTFILFDTIYPKVREYLDLWKERTVYYRYMEYQYCGQTLNVLIFNPADNRFFLLPLTNYVAVFADKELCKDRKNMIMACSEEGFLYDQKIIINDKMRDAIDTIINILYFSCLLN